MKPQEIDAALERATDVMRRRPSAGLQPDASAIARWDGGLRVVSQHPSGFAVATDMPRELGGDGEHVSPGWLVRSGMASCAATLIVMWAAREGIVLDELSVEVTSRSDLRGLLGVTERDGSAVPTQMRDIALSVRLSAAGVPTERLQALARAACQASPATRTVEQECGITVDVAVHADALAF